MRKSRKRKRATEPVRHLKTMRLAKELFLSERVASRSQSLQESEILLELWHGSKKKCNQKTEISSLDNNLSFEFKAQKVTCLQNTTNPNNMMVARNRVADGNSSSGYVITCFQCI
ncbi:hypothetical protein P5673_014405 [Acropora cervicornis]|uniref:Uncharacterized protein n=1 Tax=Acropora cervicornis TaxID=6130 RepID=A0AAD9V670_ACRCE|nr:hypothetical protein P5673_014405 [Acropora cervicornis]